MSLLDEGIESMPLHQSAGLIRCTSLEMACWNAWKICGVSQCGGLSKAT